jgi:hypothetical protein
MDKYSNNQILRDLMTDCQLKTKDIASLLTSQYGTISYRSVEAWVYDRSPLSGPTIELIMIKIDALTQQQPGQS